MDKLLLATGNPGKLLELRALLVDVPAALIGLGDLGIDLDVEEDGATYVENAVKKATAFATAAGLVSLADDTGLEVKALNGAPGLRSKRYLPDQTASDSARRGFLLQKLRAKPRPWLAQFRAAVAIALPNGEAHWAEGSCDGEIIADERGTGGFGYDAVFLVAGMGMTMAELDLSTKNRVSHRAQAVARALPLLHELFP